MTKFLLTLSFFLCFVSSPLWGQESSSRLKSKQQELEKKIATTKSLLEKASKNTEISLGKVRLIERQVSYQEQLITNIDNQIRSSELKIKEKQGKIQELNAEITKLKKQYRELLLYAYKKRSQYGQLMYIFSAKTVEEALKRRLYLEKLAGIQKKQMRLIQQNKLLLRKEITALATEKKRQEELAKDKEKQRADLLLAKKEKEQIYQQLNKQKEELKQELTAQMKTQARLKKEIARAIQRELAEERARKERARRAAEAARKAANKNKTTVEKPSDNPDFALIKANAVIGKSFATNKGRLPWPVKRGTISLDYGKHQNPNLPQVTIQNNGVDISTPLHANVLSVFKGVVTTVIDIPGAGKVVIIKHGNYRTVYANLQDVYVTKGSNVDTQTPIGSLLPDASGKISVVHFEIHEVDGRSVQQLNPDLWITKQ